MYSTSCQPPILHVIAEKQVSQPATAWHCCLEFFSVATRLPPEYRLQVEDGVARYGMRVETPSEFPTGLKGKRP
jgi:hypothetical protein